MGVPDSQTNRTASGIPPRGNRSHDSQPASSSFAPATCCQWRVPKGDRRCSNNRRWCGCGTKCIGLDWDSSSGDDGTYHVTKLHDQWQPTPWVPHDHRLSSSPPAVSGKSTSSTMPPPPLDRCSTPPTLPVRRPPGVLSPPTSDADDSLAGFRAVDCPMRPRIDDVFSFHRDDDGVWFDAWRDQQSPPTIRKETLEAHLYPVQEPTPAHSLPTQRPFTPSALRPHHNNRRCSDSLHILSWNPGSARGSDPSTLANHLNGPRHAVCVQEGAGFVSFRSLTENFHVITTHHCAVLLNKDTFDSGYM